jgi:hypothetical protein
MLVNAPTNSTNALLSHIGYVISSHNMWQHRLIKYTLLPRFIFIGILLLDLYLLIWGRFQVNHLVLYFDKHLRGATQKFGEFAHKKIAYHNS